jgi:hypothetical protein
MAKTKEIGLAILGSFGFSPPTPMHMSQGNHYSHSPKARPNRFVSVTEGHGIELPPRFSSRKTLPPVAIEIGDRRRITAATGRRQRTWCLRRLARLCFGTGRGEGMVSGRQMAPSPPLWRGIRHQDGLEKQIVGRKTNGLGGIPHSDWLRWRYYRSECVRVDSDWEMSA